jgi:hypothetical protein
MLLLANRRDSRLLADHFLKLSQLLLDDTSDFFSSAFRFKIGIVSQFTLCLFSSSFCIVKIAFNLLLCAVCHYFPRTWLLSIPYTSEVYVHVWDQLSTPKD